jgi:hypothetical protein
VYYITLTTLGWATLWATFFTNSSGHTGTKSLSCTFIFMTDSRSQSPTKKESSRASVTRRYVKKCILVIYRYLCKISLGEPKPPIKKDELKTGLPDFSWPKHTNTGKVYQMTSNYTKTAI